MPLLIMKHAERSIVDETAVLPGELAVATDTGDVFVGKKDGIKSKVIGPSEFQNLVLIGDDLPAHNVEVPTGTIGPLDIDALDISMTDGTTFNELVSSGQLTGVRGPKGSKGIAGDRGLDGQPGSASYDLTITTQEEFEAMISHPTWLDAKSVALVGDGGNLKFIRSDGNGCLIPRNVRHIKGFNNAIIEVNNFDDETAGSRAAIFHIWDTEYPDDGYGNNGFSIETLSVICNGTSNVFCFLNCDHLTSCNGTCTTADGYASVFRYCNDVVNCTASGYATGMQYYFCCSKLVNCHCIIGECEIGTGFVSSSDLFNCTCDGGTATDKGKCFANSEGLVNCAGTISSKSSNPIFGSSVFDSCRYLFNCSGTASCNYNAHCFTDCVCLANCDAVGESTSGGTGYGFYNCSYLNGCKRGGTSTTAFLGGTTHACDDLTVDAS